MIKFEMSYQNDEQKKNQIYTGITNNRMIFIKNQLIVFNVTY
jgi:hypothetical protein